jgi:hypothetical protein
VRSGVNRTPTFFINGVRHGGFFSFDGLLQAIEASAAGGAISEDSLIMDGVIPARDVAADKVLEASWEWFPASDAPGWRDHA